MMSSGKIAVAVAAGLLLGSSAVVSAEAASKPTLVFVTNRYKHAIADYFDVAYELEQKLEKAGKKELLEAVRGVIPKHVKCVFVTQSEALGLGHAVLCAKPVIGEGCERLT